MKKIIYILLLLVTVNITFSKDNFSIKPILINLYGSCGKDSIIIAFGDNGNALISNDNDKTWETIKIFEYGVITEMFFEDDRIIAFTKDGQIAVSYDSAKSWVYFKIILFNEDLIEKVSYMKIVSTPLGYVIRTLNNVYFVDKNFIINKSLKLKIPSFIADNKLYLNRRNPIIYDKFEDKIILIIDTFKVNLYDQNLNFLNEKDFKNSIFCENCFNSYSLNYDSSFYYFQYNRDIFKFNKSFTNSYKISNNLKNSNFEYVFNNIILINDSYGPNYKSIDSLGNIFDFIKNPFNRYIKNGIDQATITTEFRRINLILNKLIITDTYNRLFIATLNSELDSVIDFKTVSCASYRDPDGFQIKKLQGINELVTTYSYGENGLSNDMTTINVNSNLFTPIVKRGDSNNLKDTNSPFNYLVNGEFPVHFVDKVNGNIYAGGIISGQNESDVYVSKDNGYIFERIKIPINTFTYPYKTQSLKENINNDLIFHLTGKNFKFHVSEFLYFDKNLNYNYKITLNNTNAIYYVSLDTNNYLFLDNFNNKLSIKSTTDKGENWEVYKEYPNTTNLLESKELEINGKKIWAYTYYDFVTSQFSLDVINVEERKVYNVFSSQVTQDQIDSIDYIGFDAAKEKFYLSFYNTLMVSSNIFEDNIKWEIFNYPNNGKVNKKFQIFDKTIFARYEDDKNEDNVYWINGIEMVGDPTSVEDIEEINYLYTMPPYPNPTVSEVTAKFYWDSRIDIDNSEIAVFDLNGNKVSGKENLTLEKLNEWSGNIKWNCIGVPSGTYLIKIHHGNNTKSVKVVVN